MRSAPAGLTARLADAGGALVLPKGEAPGLAMGLGGVGVTLNDLTMLYAGFARGGNTVALTERARRDRSAGAAPADRSGRRLVHRQRADRHAAAGECAGGRIAFKTGTSYGYRDAWAVGFDGKRTIGVWVGRPDGAPVPGLVGRTAAAPILFDAFARTGQAAAPLAAGAEGRDLPRANNRLPLPLQRFRPTAGRRQRRARRASCSRPTARGSNAAEAGADMALKISGGVAPLTVLVNGVPRNAAGEPAHTVLYAGRARLRAADRDGRTRRRRQRLGPHRITVFCQQF